MAALIMWTCSRVIGAPTASKNFCGDDPLKNIEDCAPRNEMALCLSFPSKPSFNTVEPVFLARRELVVEEALALLQQRSEGLLKAQRRHASEAASRATRRQQPWSEQSRAEGTRGVRLIPARARTAPIQKSHVCRSGTLLESRPAYWAGLPWPSRRHQLQRNASVQAPDMQATMERWPGGQVAASRGHHHLEPSE